MTTPDDADVVRMLVEEKFDALAAVVVAVRDQYVQKSRDYRDGGSNPAKRPGEMLCRVPYTMLRAAFDES